MSCPIAWPNISNFSASNSFGDLAPGTLGILEPKPELREQDQRRAEVQELDLLVIPGLAFDRQGGRLGYGKGYFDRLLPGARPDALLAAVAFECQLFDAVPMQPYDVRVDAVITESRHLSSHAAALNMRWTRSPQLARLTKHLTRQSIGGRVADHDRADHGYMVPAPVPRTVHTESVQGRSRCRQRDDRLLMAW